MVELKRNPQGVIDKKTRATLRPIAKSRRDSVASELEDKIKDAKLQHSKYRYLTTYKKKKKNLSQRRT